jgi:hypothetical protein
MIFFSVVFFPECVTLRFEKAPKPLNLTYEFSISFTTYKISSLNGKFFQSSI